MTSTGGGGTFPIDPKGAGVPGNLLVDLRTDMLERKVKLEEGAAKTLPSRQTSPRCKIVHMLPTPPCSFTGAPWCLWAEWPPFEKPRVSPYLNIFGFN